MSDDLFAAIDALLERPKPADDLPVPAERERLRKAAEYTQEELAAALKTRRETIVRWEAGSTDPRPPKREVYIRFLATLALRHGTVEPTEWLRRAQAAGLAPAADQAPAPVAESTVAAPAEATPTAPAPAPAPVLATFDGDQAVELDRDAAGDLVAGQPQPCARCGRPTPYRSGGRPVHMGGWCTAAAQPAAAEQAPATVAPPVAPARPAAGPAAAPRRTGSSRPAAASRARKAPAKAASTAEGPSDWEAAAAARFPAGPLAVLDVAPNGKGLAAYLADGTQAPTAPTGRTLADVVEWALEVKLGSPRLHRHGKDGDALVVLTDAALAELGLPPMGRDEKREFVQRLGQLPKTHKAVKQVEKAGWLLTQRGLGPWARVYRTPEDGKRQCVQLCIPAWGALASGGWQIPDGLPAADLARLLGTYAKRVLTPRGSTAVSGLELVTALRPPTRAVRTDAGWTSGAVEGSRPKDAFDPAPPEVPDVHPLAQDREPGGELVTEAWDWHRELTDAEQAAPFAVGLDVNMAFLAAAGRLVLPLSGPVHELNPAFDQKVPGSWLVDLSGVETSPLLPSPFTADGSRPTGPAWYSTAKVAYARELGATVQPTEGWLRHQSGPYLDPWHKRLRAAYVDTMAALGVPLTLADTDPLAFLDAMAAIKQGDPAELAVLTAIKQTAKGTIGKMRERPRGHGYKPGERWAALERPTWDPLMRALVIDTATVNLHRKLRKMTGDTGLHCFAVLSDCAVFASSGPGALDVLTKPDGTLTTSLRLGVSPGMVKFEGSRPMGEVLELVADGTNPARHMKAGGVVSADE
ncbi:helix-turn-helix transcriptional regulator [Kitasatospora sp. MBT66]|uniref:telomere-associated protein Tap n=1 Tax=Kitasatospora sp. MBT66 TaxID=1444769 RepID=UPI0005BCC290|nr:helix-turn-helix transcriptional regulator [Kitasatospora sp. MBT66]